MAKYSFVASADPDVIVLDENGQEIEKEAPPEALPKYLERRATARPAVAPRKATPKVEYKSDRAGNIFMAALFGLVITAVIWWFGASTTVGFLHGGLKLRWSYELGLRKLSGGFLGDYTLDLLWLFPVGLTYFQMRYRPPLTLRDLIKHIQADPLMTFFWAGLTTIGVGTSFFGLIEWIRDNISKSDYHNPIVLAGALIIAFAIEYLCEPYAMRFVKEIKIALEAK